MHQVTPPLNLLDRTTLLDVDDQDCSLVDVGPPLSDRSAEQWARAVFEDAPAATRNRLATG